MEWPDGAQTAGIAAGVVVVLNGLAARYLVPKYLREREEFETRIQREQNQLRKDFEATMAELRERWHKRNNRLNVSVGRLSMTSERHTAAIQELTEQSRRAQETMHRVDKTCSEMRALLEGRVKREGA